MQHVLRAAAEFAHAAATSDDVVSLVALAGESCRALTGGSAWRFLSLDPESGALALDARGGAAVLPTPGGIVEWLLENESPRIAVQDRRGDPGLEDALWQAKPGAVAGWPLRSGRRLHGILLVAFAPPLASAPDGALAIARLLTDPLAVALDRHALAIESRARATALAELESRADDGEAKFSELISVVAHEIRTPLTSIKAYTETLIDAPAGEFEERREFLGIIDAECDRLARLVSDALDLSRLEAGQRALKVRAVEPAEFVESLAQILAPEVERQELALAWFVDPALASVEADPDLLKQLVLNLAGNAIKFSPKGGRVTIDARADGPDWRIAVEDSGTGIPEEHLERIFERFYRIEKKGGRRIPGTGLGLAIARHIAELHAGRIDAANAAEGGSVFTVRLPQRQLAPARVRRVAGSLADRADVRGLLFASVRMVSEVMQSEIVSVMLVDPREGDLVVAAACGLDDAALERRHPYRGGLAGAVIRGGQPVLVEDVETDRRFSRKSHPQYFTKSLVCAPIVVAGEIVGVLNVNNKVNRDEFDATDLERVTALAARLSAALQRAQAYPDAPSVVAEATAAMHQLARVRGEFAVGNAELVRWAADMGERLGLDGDERAAVARLLEGEAHTPAASDVSARARHILVARGEHFDGSGFPNGLAGRSIPAGARVLAVLDAFVARTAGEPYRPALTAGEAVEWLRERAGRAFDPDAVEALAAALGDDGSIEPRREVA